jgi:hypothetical protein
MRYHHRQVSLAQRLNESRDVDRGCRLTAAAFEIGDHNDHRCPVMTYCRDGGDRLSVQRGEVIGKEKEQPDPAKNTVAAFGPKPIISVISSLGGAGTVDES